MVRVYIISLQGVFDGSSGLFSYFDPVEVSSIEDLNEVLFCYFEIFAVLLEEFLINHLIF